MARIINTAVAEVATQVIGLDDNVDHDINTEDDNISGIVFIKLHNGITIDVEFNADCTTEYIPAERATYWYPGTDGEVNRNWSNMSINIIDAQDDYGNDYPIPALPHADMAEVKEYIDEEIMRQEELV